MTRDNTSTCLNEHAPAILRQLLYYDIFDHPLSEGELLKDCSIDNNQRACLKELQDKHLIFKLNGFYSLRDDPELSKRRKKGGENTEKAMPKAIRMGRLISHFPFIRAVALSGSISKGYMDSYKDVDYFIITKPNRLWLARTLLVIYKKVFLLNSFRYFCLNYFVDEENLEIDDKNIFTATEINTMIPIYGHSLIKKLYSANSWVADYYQNYPQRGYEMPGQKRDKWPKRVLEWMFSGSLGNRLDLFAMRFTIRYWKKKYRKDTRNLFDNSFRFDRKEAKYHPGDFQTRILEEFNKKVTSFEKKNHFKIDDNE